MSIVEKARRYSEMAHAGQTRKYTGEPYATHPAAVSGILRQLGFSAEVLAAAHLHDTVEDTPTTLEELRREFGYRVAALVDQVTDPSIGHPGNREVRKEIDRQHLANADSEGQSIKMADLIHNSHSIVEHDPNFAKVYMTEMSRLWSTLTLAHPDLRERVLVILNDYERSRLPKF